MIKIKDLLKDYHSEINTLTVLSLNNKKSCLGNIRFFELEKTSEVETKLKTLLDSYGENSFRIEKINSCCAPTYNQISFNVTVD